MLQRLKLDAAVSAVKPKEKAEPPSSDPGFSGMLALLAGNPQPGVSPPPASPSLPAHPAESNSADGPGQASRKGADNGASAERAASSAADEPQGNIPPQDGSQPPSADPAQGAATSTAVVPLNASAAQNVPPSGPATSDGIELDANAVKPVPAEPPTPPPASSSAAIPPTGIQVIPSPASPEETATSSAQTTSTSNVQTASLRASLEQDGGEVPAGIPSAPVIKTGSSTRSKTATGLPTEEPPIPEDPKQTKATGPLEQILEGPKQAIPLPETRESQAPALAQAETTTQNLALITSQITEERESLPSGGDARAQKHLLPPTGDASAQQIQPSKLPSPTSISSTTASPQAATAFSQVEGTVRWMLKNQEKGAELQLHPDNLGRITISLKVEGDEVHARIWASETTTVAVLQNHRESLQQSLQQQGLNLGSFDLHSGHRGEDARSGGQSLPSAPLRATPREVESVQDVPMPTNKYLPNPHRIELLA